MGLIGVDRAPVYGQPSARSSIVTVLVREAQIEVLKRGESWSRVRVWNSINGWVRSAEIVYREPWTSVSTYRAPVIKYPVRASKSQPLHAIAVTTERLRLAVAPGAVPTRSLLPNSRIVVNAWQQDGSDAIWYRIDRDWAPAYAVRFAFPNPGTDSKEGRPLWAPVTGKGMWLTLGTVAGSQPSALVHAAVTMGITHLYVEAAISPLGFHGREVVSPLLRAAHASHVAVIAWVYPYLEDLAADVSLTREVAAFKTKSGDRFDGIAADLERNFSPTNVRTYSQIVRAYLGNTYLLVGVTYPPQSSVEYPFVEVARVYNAIAPMDYWHQTETASGLNYGNMRYGYAYAFRYAMDSIHFIRRVSGTVPVVPIGQTFDNGGHLEMGPHAPSSDEIRGFLAGSRAGGAKGISFFQWMTAQVGEWRAISAFRL